MIAFLLGIFVTIVSWIYVCAWFLVSFFLGIAAVVAGCAGLRRVWHVIGAIARGGSFGSGSSSSSSTNLRDLGLLLLHIVVSCAMPTIEFIEKFVRPPQRGRRRGRAASGSTTATAAMDASFEQRVRSVAKQIRGVEENAQAQQQQQQEEDRHHQRKGLLLAFLDEESVRSSVIGGNNQYAPLGAEPSSGLYECVMERRNISSRKTGDNMNAAAGGGGGGNGASDSGYERSTLKLDFAYDAQGRGWIIRGSQRTGGTTDNNSSNNNNSQTSDSPSVGTATVVSSTTKVIEEGFVSSVGELYFVSSTNDKSYRVLVLGQHRSGSFTGEWLDSIGFRGKFYTTIPGSSGGYDQGGGSTTAPLPSSSAVPTERGDGGGGVSSGVEMLVV